MVGHGLLEETLGPDRQTVVQEKLRVPDDVPGVEGVELDGLLDLLRTLGAPLGVLDPCHPRVVEGLVILRFDAQGVVEHGKGRAVITALVAADTSAHEIPNLLLRALLLDGGLGSRQGPVVLLPEGGFAEGVVGLRDVLEEPFGLRLLLRVLEPVRVMLAHQGAESIADLRLRRLLAQPQNLVKGPWCLAHHHL